MRFEQIKKGTFFSFLIILAGCKSIAYSTNPLSAVLALTIAFFLISTCLAILFIIDNSNRALLFIAIFTFIVGARALSLDASQLFPGYNHFALRLEYPLILASTSLLFFCIKEHFKRFFSTPRWYTFPASYLFLSVALFFLPHSFQQPATILLLTISLISFYALLFLIRNNPSPKDYGIFLAFFTLSYLAIIYAAASEKAVVEILMHLPLSFSLFQLALVKDSHSAELEKRLVDQLAIKSAKLVKANFDLEVLNQELETEIVSRTREVRGELLSTEATLSELKRAHWKIERDLTMASNVQRLYFSQKIPRVQGWEIAFIYIPMRQVSGDMFDFYIQEGELLGTSLFDVSGHGVQSALITMLAKNIIAELFYKLYEKPVGNILEIINKRLIEEIGAMDNYMTGLLLKVRDNVVEIANASHANILHRINKTGAVRELEPRDTKGNFVGIELMDEPYLTDSYFIETEDSLLLYSDGIYEQKEERGISTDSFTHLKESFAKCKPYQSAQSQLDYILNAFGIKSQTKEASDDMTAILLKRI